MPACREMELIAKVDVTSILDKRSKEACQTTVEVLKTLYQELAESPELPEVEWTRLRDLEFQEMLRHRIGLTDRLSRLGCQRCPNFEESVRNFIVISRWLLTTVRYFA